MIDVVSVKFKNRGKVYFFAPNGYTVKTGEKVVVETAKGLELADCCQGNHPVPDDAVVQPLRPVARPATAEDLRVAEYNKRREKDAFQICQKKIAAHGLDMKLVDVECNFEGSKITFFFTSDGRVDFRELVKDLAGVFRSRIELRQIGVRDEAKMIGGIGICGRPYCCHQFLDDFQPVSTKMAKVQALSLNPAKISGSCGRLMCCLRYEQEAYEELIKNVPKQGAFVETKDGYGTAVQVNLLRQTVQVRLDGDNDDTLRSYRACELAAVPGGRPKDGETPPSVLKYVPPEEPEEEDSPADEWEVPLMIAPDPEPVQESERQNSRKRGRKRGPRQAGPAGAERPEAAAEASAREAQDRPRKERAPQRRREEGKAAKAPEKPAAKSPAKPGAKSVKVEAKVRPAKKEPQPKKESAPVKEAEARQEGAGKKPGRRRNYYRGRPKGRPAGE